MVLSNPALHLGPYILTFWFDVMSLGMIIYLGVAWHLERGRKNERGLIKCIVYAVVLLSCFASLLFTRWMLDLFAYGFGRLYVDFFSVKYVNWFPVFGNIAICITQIFYTERAYRLNGNRIIIPIILGILILACMGGSISLRIVTYSVKGFFKPSPQMARAGKFSLYTAMLSAVLIDIILLALITIGLLRARTGWTHTNHLIKRLIRMSFETQLPGTLFTLASVIQFTFFGLSPYNVVFCIIQPKISTLSFLILLHGRDHLQQGLSATPNDYQPRPAIYDQEGDARAVVPNLEHTSQHPLPSDMEDAEKAGSQEEKNISPAGRVNIHVIATIE
ncbi:hypothetical protein CI109_101773 [Kwoniella shandongensis]|uniref:DUF6534 domain-containing protein n=1 Tax=Kwoniella shandongensis TaxID=1734106 RepID=A0AAJ8MVL7_9TREE